MPQWLQADWHARHSFSEHPLVLFGERRKYACAEFFFSWPPSRLEGRHQLRRARNIFWNCPLNVLLISNKKRKYMCAEILIRWNHSSGFEPSADTCETHFFRLSTWCSIESRWKHIWRRNKLWWVFRSKGVLLKNVRFVDPSTHEYKWIETKFDRKIQVLRTENPVTKIFVLLVMTSKDSPDYKRDQSCKPLDFLYALWWTIRLIVEKNQPSSTLKAFKWRTNQQPRFSSQMCWTLNTSTAHIIWSDIWFGRTLLDHRMMENGWNQHTS